MFPGGIERCSRVLIVEFEWIFAHMKIRENSNYRKTNIKNNITKNNRNKATF